MACVVKYNKISNQFELATNLKAESIINRDFYKAFIEDEMKGKIEIKLEKL